MGTLSSSIRQLATSEVAPAAQVMARAFFDDPLWRFLVPAPRKRQHLILRINHVFMRAAVRSGQLWGVCEPLEGVAVWSAPGEAGSFDNLLRSGFLSLLFSPILPAFLRAGAIFRRFEIMQKTHAPGPHYYLNTIAVLPQSQGKGLASRLIRPFLARADAEGVGVYTETMTPSNVTLYQHYGFRVVEQYNVPKTDLILWAFYRQ